jgi:hypothetical protein
VGNFLSFYWQIKIEYHRYFVIIGKIKTHEKNFTTIYAIMFWLGIYASSSSSTEWCVHHRLGRNGQCN